MEKAVFGAGCFWGVEAAFRRIKGVKTTSVGYAGGTTDNPTYEDVCSGTTGHAEVVEVEYDPGEVSYDDLLETFWSVTTRQRSTARALMSERSTVPRFSPPTPSRRRRHAPRKRGLRRPPACPGLS